jgi:hypothetical protein
VARVVAFVPDLLFGSNVLGALQAAGHEAVLASDPQRAKTDAVGADVLIVDLTADARERIDWTRALRPAGTPVLAFYSHVEATVREEAQDAGFELVVPRSRMAREGPALVDQLLQRS